VDFDNRFILVDTLTPAAESGSKYLPYLMIASCHTKDPIEKALHAKEILDNIIDRSASQRNKG
jgi:hypothetical protein